MTVPWSVWVCLTRLTGPKNNYVEEIDILQIWRDISKSGKWSFINIQMLNYWRHPEPPRPRHLIPNYARHEIRLERFFRVVPFPSFPPNVVHSIRSTYQSRHGFGALHSSKLYLRRNHLNPIYGKIWSSQKVPSSNELAMMFYLEWNDFPSTILDIQLDIISDTDHCLDKATGRLIETNCVLNVLEATLFCAMAVQWVYRTEDLNVSEKQICYLYTERLLKKEISVVYHIEKIMERLLNRTAS